MGRVNIKGEHFQRQGIRGIHLTVDQHLKWRDKVEGCIKRSHRKLLCHEHLLILVQILRVGFHLPHYLDTVHQVVVGVYRHDKLSLCGATHLELHMRLLANI